MFPAKAQRRQVRNSCHFDQREKSLLDPSHSLGMTGIGPSPLRLGVPSTLLRTCFAGDSPSFGYDCSPEANLFFPAQSGEKRVLLSLIICAARANYPVALRNEGKYKRTHRGGTEGAEGNVINQETLLTLRTQRLCGEIMKVSLVAA